MTATQAPTPGPLSGNHTALVATINYLRADEGDTVSLLCDNPDFSGQPSNAVECNGGWTDWTDKRFNGDSLFAALNNAALAKAVATKTLAPTAPVEASGSVGLAASEIGAHIAKRDAEYEAALADLTIKPDASSLEEFGRSIFGALSDCPAMSIDKQADFVARALWPAVSALSTTPARAEAQHEQPDITPYTEDLKGLKAAMQAEAQDEGAAEEAWIIDAGASAWATMDREEAARFSQKEEFKVRPLVTAHPSPTPAADADRVRIAVEALEPFVPVWAKLTGLSDGIDVRLDASFALQDATGRARGATCNPNLPKLTVGDFRKAHEARAALKSTAAKEGGK